MQFSENWLRTWIDPKLSTEELAHLLTMAGLEVEGCDPVAPEFSGVVVAQVISVEKHPNADRLNVCQVDVGADAALNIVCGAPNVRAGIRVACAMIGAHLPGEGGKSFDIKPVKMRGIESFGMLCSARELGIGENTGGLLELADNAPIGADLRQHLRLDDHALTLKLTPNRADCLSIQGVAREVAALTDAPLKAAPIAAVPASIDDRFPVHINAPQCGRFATRVIRNVDANAVTPEWMIERLARSGQRSISALVDVSNYVMLELGQPLHVYDLAKLKGGIEVRMARQGETLELLNEQRVELDESVLLIADESGPIGLAGIMGGESTKADLDTRDILVESAFFYPDAIAGRARHFGVPSEAAHRFERGVDFQGNIAGLERATQLILQICGGQAGPSTERVAQLPERKPVHLRTARAAKIIGVEIPDARIADIFERLGFSPTAEPDAFTVIPPSYRFDIEIEEDLIEEIARVYGFENIPAKPPLAPALMRVAPENRRSQHALRAAIAAVDYQEVVNFGFVEAQWEADFAANNEPLKLLNPIASHLSVMRSSLIGGLVANARYNLSHKAARVRVFELGRVFLRAPQMLQSELEVAGISQPLRIAGLAIGSAVEEQWGMPTRAVDYFDVKGDIEAAFAPSRLRFVKAIHPALHPGRSAHIELDGEVIGCLGELHPRWQQKYELPGAAILFELDVQPLLDVPVPRYQEVAKSPMVVRDCALIVDDAICALDMLDALRAHSPAFVQSVRLFDLYRGKGVPESKKSVAFRVVMQDTARTLTDAEVDAAVTELTKMLALRFGAQQRS